MRSNFPRFYSFIEALPLKNTGSNLFSEAKKTGSGYPEPVGTFCIEPPAIIASGVSG